MPICILACITVVYVYFRRNTNHLFRKSVKRYSARFTLFLSARERAMDIIGYNYLKTMQNLYSENYLLAQHLSAKNLLANSTDENFIRFWSLFPLNCITLRSSIFLLRREVVYHTTPYLSSHPPDQSESSVGNASAPHSYRSQAVCDFLWRIPSADTSLSERNIILPQSYEKYEIRQRNPVKNKIIPVISVRNVEPLIEFVEPILRLSCVKR